MILSSLLIILSTISTISSTQNLRYVLSCYFTLFYNVWQSCITWHVCLTANKMRYFIIANMLFIISICDNIKNPFKMPFYFCHYDITINLTESFFIIYRKTKYKSRRWTLQRKFVTSVHGKTVFEVFC